MLNLCAQSCQRTLFKPYYGSSNMQRGDKAPSIDGLTYSCLRRSHLLTLKHVQAVQEACVLITEELKVVSQQKAGGVGRLGGSP